MLTTGEVSLVEDEDYTVVSFENKFIDNGESTIEQNSYCRVQLFERKRKQTKVAIYVDRYFDQPMKILQIPATREKCQIFNPN